jgi:hypothetical protein
MERFEIQTKIDGKWTLHSVIDADEDGARKAWRYIAGTQAAACRLVTNDYKGRVAVVATQSARSGYRVTYGETIPVWSRVLPTKAKADAFAAKHRRFGDIVFGIDAV